MSELQSTLGSSGTKRSLAVVEPVHMMAYVEALGHAMPSVSLHLAALLRLPCHRWRAVTLAGGRRSTAYLLAQIGARRSP